MISGYGCSGNEVCRFCGYNIPLDTVAVMNHYNNHWRQYNLENLSLNACAFEPQVDIRISRTPINPDDLEVCTHLEHNNFQYSYSPQTEPSKFSIIDPCCSPLNLTGKPKSTSPLSNESHPHIQPLQDHNPTNTLSVVPQHNMVTNPSLNSAMGLSNSYNTYPLQSVYPSCLNNGMQVNSFPMSSNINSVTLHENSGTDNYSSLKKDKRIMTNDDVKCHLCSRNFCSKTYLDEHNQLCYSKVPVISQITCNPYLPAESSNLNHSLQNPLHCAAEVKPYKCSICDKEFTYREELLIHVKEHENSKPHKCALCGTGLSQASALKRHMMAHSGHKPHCCDICGRRFSQKFDLQRHYITHGRKKEVKCEKCKKKYSSNTFLKNHKCKPPEQPKPFKCSICGEGCSTNIGWSYHMWKHTKDPVFVPFHIKNMESSVEQKFKDSTLLS